MKEPKPPTEFDAYAREYAELLRDPLREKFAGGGGFFFERKCQVIQDFYKKRGIRTQSLDWMDVGCGQGDLLRLGHPAFKSATGCDPSEQMLRFCSDFQVKLQTTLDRLPFDDAAFDFITVVCVFHHIPEEQRPALMLEIKRVLKVGGVVCIMEHNPLNPATRLIVSRTPVDHDARMLRMSQTRKLCFSAGARILESDYFLLFPRKIYAPLAPIERMLSRMPLGGQYAVFAEKSAHV